MNHMSDKDRAVNWIMQTAQALMLAMLLGGGGWWANMIWGTLRETQSVVNDIKGRLIRLEADDGMIARQLDKFETWKNEASHRLDVLESRQKP